MPQISRKTKHKRGSVRDGSRGLKRTYDEGLIDRAELCKMDIFGTSQAQLARQLSSLRPYTLTQQTVSRDLKIIKDEFFYIKNLHLTDRPLFEKKFFKDRCFTKVWCSLNPRSESSQKSYSEFCKIYGASRQSKRKTIA